VTAKDIKYLLRKLFVNDSYKYLYKRARVQTRASLALFIGPRARASTIVKLSIY
jgi:hypothetical protein